MTTTSTYDSQTQLGPINYRVRATAQQDVLLEVFGADPEGAVVAEGMIRLPVSGGAAVGKLLGRVLDGLTRMGAPPPGKPQPANAKQPWTAELDEELREAWLDRADQAPVAELIRSLADRMGRSPTSIRSRLPRVGCDPDVVGRPLSQEAAQVLGVTP
ncbi:hypothetical protein ACFFQW_08895 [Umezawaea endophytica]|uniref:Uncharacterized protein n=1 Tax=Umezawaea endophytica TaxID=1654476 RepID=A0A9X2VGA4_9PSEU|nr:hypothetical protein [Umezawaea endophytica]MCS7476103.1 hypothetical protein [Umezawaea endophytica]